LTRINIALPILHKEIEDLRQLCVFRPASRWSAKGSRNARPGPHASQADLELTKPAKSQSTAKPLPPSKSQTVDTLLLAVEL